MAINRETDVERAGMRYDDLDFRIRADGDGFMVTVGRGAQVATAPFDLDFARSWDLWKPVPREPDDAKALGGRLLEALLRGGLRDIYQQAKGSGGGDAKRGLRVRIHLDPRDHRLRPLLRLPWEILCDRADGAGLPLALDRRSPVVRTIDSTAEILSPSAAPLSRVLVALASPRDAGLLDLERERDLIEGALDGIHVRPSVLLHATRASLLESIRDRDFQIVHITGHGLFDEETGEGLLLLESARGNSDAITARMLAGMFAGKAMPRLVVLSACHSAGAGGVASAGPFASLAATLVASGLPAVVAMQTAVADRSAILFAERLYRHLAKGQPIEAAVTEGRVALSGTFRNTLDWAVPVLFVRGQPAAHDASADSTSANSASPPSPSPEPRMPEAILRIYNRKVKNQFNAPVKQVTHVHGGKSKGRGKK
jgi:hypothetical protein